MDSPLVLSMCDTLLQRSEESGDKHMQIISYCIKLDYFYIIKKNIRIYYIILRQILTLLSIMMKKVNYI